MQAAEPRRATLGALPAAVTASDTSKHGFRLQHQGFFRHVRYKTIDFCCRNVSNVSYYQAGMQAAEQRAAAQGALPPAETASDASNTNSVYNQVTTTEVFNTCQVLGPAPLKKQVFLGSS